MAALLLLSSCLGQVAGMTTRSGVDASIDAFWSSAGLPRPPDHGMKRRPPKSSRSCSGSRPGGGSETLAPSPRRATSSRPKAEEAGGRQEDRYPELKHITVEISGREGFNSAAVNGLWNFCGVRHGRLAFFRDAEVCGGSEPEDGEDAVLRLFLHYVPEVDNWLISDVPDLSGTVVADCGPVGRGSDLQQRWRVWDEDGWREDENVVVKVDLGSSPPGNLRGLAVIPGVAATGNTGSLSARARARPQVEGTPPQLPMSARAARPGSQDGRQTCDTRLPPVASRPPDIPSAPLRTPRR